MRSHNLILMLDKPERGLCKYIFSADSISSESKKGSQQIADDFESKSGSLTIKSVGRLWIRGLRTHLSRLILGSDLKKRYSPYFDANSRDCPVGGERLR